MPINNQIDLTDTYLKKLAYSIAYAYCVKYGITKPITSPYQYISQFAPLSISNAPVNSRIYNPPVTIPYSNDTELISAVTDSIGAMYSERIRKFKAEGDYNDLFKTLKRVCNGEVISPNTISLYSLQLKSNGYRDLFDQSVIPLLKSLFDTNDISTLSSFMFGGDAMISIAQFLEDRYDLSHNLSLSGDYVSPDGLKPYSVERIERERLSEQLKIIQAQELQSLLVIANQMNPALALSISQTATATDPLTQRLMQLLTTLQAGKIFGSSTALSADQLKAALLSDQPLVEMIESFGKSAEIVIPDNSGGQINLPPGDMNVPTQQDARENILDSILDSIKQSNVTTWQNLLLSQVQSVYSAGAEYYAPLINKVFENANQAEELARWASIYPKVELLAVDNPQVSSYILNAAWKGSNPPIVSVRITPRQKPLPQVKRSSFSKVWGILGPIVSIIPVVGQVASLVGGIVNMEEQQKMVQTAMANMMTTIQPQPMFEPQYYPSPFNIVLTLDYAQLAVKYPQYIYAIYDRFNKNESAAILARLNSANQSNTIDSSMTQNKNPQVRNLFALAWMR